MISRLITVIQEIIYPRFCCHCRSIGWHLCPKCQLLCEFSIVQPDLPPDTNLTSITAAFAFTPPISEAIKIMKYQCVKQIAHWLGELLYYHTNYPDADVVTSVPVSTEKRRWRGFNQAEIIARAFSSRAGIPYRELLTRVHEGSTNQASLIDRRERQLNIKSNLFRCIPSPSPPESVILIDDVYTTGRTLEACAAQLIDHGVKQVHGLVVAHGR